MKKISKDLVIFLFAFFLVHEVKSKDKLTAENSALTFFIDSILPKLPHRDSLVYIMKKSLVGLGWGTFYGGIQSMPLSQFDSSNLKKFNDSLISDTYDWKWRKRTGIPVKPNNQKILNTKSSLKLKYLNNRDKFKYLSEHELSKYFSYPNYDDDGKLLAQQPQQKNGFYIMVSNGVYLSNLSIVVVGIEPFNYSVESKGFYLFLDKDNRVMRYYEIVPIANPQVTKTMNGYR